MIHRTFPALERDVSAIGLGCWQIGAEWGPVSEGEALRILHAAWDAGITFFDTADVYGRGRSESLIGRFLRESNATPTVATKLGRFQEPGWPWNLRGDAVPRFVENSLERLGVDTLDLVQLHCVPLDVIARGDMIEALRKLRDAGKIRAWGASVETMQEAEFCLQQEDCASLQVIFNVLRQRPRDVLFDRAREQGTAIIVRLPLASGLLSGKFSAASTFHATDHRSFNREGGAFHVGETFTGLPFEKGLEIIDELRGILPAHTDLAQASQRWILDHEAVTTVITGATRTSQVHANARAADLPELGAAMHHRLAAWERESVRPYVRGHGES